ncbi:TfoX/Sxy family DNA transformation protein [Phocoenobacter skyensis]|uniref:DNA transformation protein n=1 Tax=Phocoenobacter skyensis TaxID=97481 RepID=A0A1H7V1R3_9PAST|nr:TfoX/Sxy family DNA transformation protein [Pasteurella skyensis]MDP8078496.1 TfoX/Sxy family DNA transformation protein [Pasteurella skyensis]MDP8084412.1 TfoX/Sxy family DNA transformation protein [Pasteurella skyensis]MDP8184743.1 TfoX/Sxy family DNA transformation protein [Pasteurella skyensis]SEM02657.1 DNA transformation protein [Pasteurella skyensis]
MNKVQNNTIKIRGFLKPFVGSLIVKTYFSYYGLFKDDTMFGLYKNNQFFLKIPNNFSKKDNLSNFLDLRSVLMGDFYLFPEDKWEQLSQKNNWLLTLVEELNLAKQNAVEPKLIRHLPNMNINLERLLYRNGVKTVHQLYKLGAVKVFVRLIEKGIDVAETLLFKLYGALNNQLVYTLDHKQKATLLKKADSELYDVGLRKRFTI